MPMKLEGPWMLNPRGGGGGEKQKKKDW
jgi:hypothetical protein